MQKTQFTLIDSRPVHYMTPLFRRLSTVNWISLSVYYLDDSTYLSEAELDQQEVENNRRSIESSFLGVWEAMIRKLMLREEEVVLIFGWDEFSKVILLFFLTLFTSESVLLWGESPLNQELNKPIWKRFLKSVLFGEILFPSISGFLYIGEENKKFYRYYGVPERKLYHVPYAVDNDRFNRAKQNLDTNDLESLRVSLDIRNEEPVILFVGKLIQKKRPFDLLNAYKLCQEKSSTPVHLIFVGEGELRDSLVSTVKMQQLSNVHFTGFVDQKDLPKYYGIADIFVLPSGMGETWGVVVNEAMNFSLPIIVSDMVGSGPDLVQSGKNGYRFPVGNVDALSEKLQKLIENESLDKYGQESRKIVHKFSYTRDMQGISKVLREIRQKNK